MKKLGFERYLYCIIYVLECKCIIMLILLWLYFVWRFYSCVVFLGLLCDFSGGSSGSSMIDFMVVD